MRIMRSRTPTGTCTTRTHTTAEINSNHTRKRNPPPWQTGSSLDLVDSIMRLPSVTTLVGNEIGERGLNKWYDSVAGADGCIYGIPSCALRVVKYNPADDSLKEIGPDFGSTNHWKWDSGVLAGNGSIYCIPHNDFLGDIGILKIDTVNETVTIVNVEEPPETSVLASWSPGALALDGCIYFMPCHARRILKFDPENESVASVGEDLGDDRSKYFGTVRGIDGCLYGIPYHEKRIARYNPIDQSITFVGEETDRFFFCSNGVEGRDGCIYALNSFYGAQLSIHRNAVLRIDVANNSYSFVWSGNKGAFSGAILGNDGCIYWPPAGANRTLKFDPETQVASFVGDDLEPEMWNGGASGPDGAIFCMPSTATRVLVIDPFKEFVMNVQANLEQYPEELGRIFEKDDHSNTAYECAVTKFGTETVFQVIQDCIPSSVVCSGSDIESFVVAASLENSALSVIYGLLRKNLDTSPLSNYCAIENQSEATESKKRKRG